MDIAAQLQTALESLVTQYTTLCANPKPNYSIDGQSFSHADLLRTVKDAIKETSELVSVFAPVEARSIAL